MPAATNKTDLSAATVKEYDKLSALIENIDRDIALRKRDGDTSIKDVIAHRGHWIGLFLGWYADGKAGKTVAIPAEGYKWNQLKAYNAKLRADQTGLGWDDAVTMLASAHGDLLAFIDSHDDATLYGGPMKGGGSKWTTGRWAEAAGPSHYRSAAKWIRGCLKVDAAKS